jgi:general secretion pathway protein A
MAMVAAGYTVSEPLCRAAAAIRVATRCIILGIVYTQFYALKKMPFRLRPDAEFLYAGPGHVRASNSMVISLEQHSRAHLLIGHPGLGKTVLLDDVIGAIGATHAVCRIRQPRVSADELLESLLLQIGTCFGETELRQPRSQADRLDCMASIAAGHKPPLAAVDDAHLLPAATINSLNDVLKRIPRLKLILCGRSGQGLEESAVHLLAGEHPKITRLTPLSAEETREYIDHRLVIAGSQHRELLSAEAHAMIYQHTGGAPRLINVLCDAALHGACLRAGGQLGPAEVLLATQEAGWAEAVARDRPQFVIRDAPEVSTESITADPSTAKLVVARGKETLSTWALSPGRVTIGRARDNEFRLDARFISRHHCRVTTVGNVSTIEDLQSVNGISINGRPVKRHVLRHADCIQMGDHTLTYMLS